MNQYEAQQPGNGAPGQGVPPQEQGGASNPYAAQYQQQAAPDLDAGAPQLKGNDARRTNRNAMLMLGTLAALLVFGVLWAFFATSSRNNAQPNKAQKEETVSVPEAPAAPPPLPMPVRPTAQQAQPIPLAPPLPKSNTQSTAQNEPKGPSLVERRIAAAAGGSASNAGDSGSGNGGGQGSNNGAPPATVGMLGMNDGTNQFRMPANANYTSANKLPDVSNAQPLTHPDNLMLRGTYVRCVLETRIITDIPGFTSCIVTEPVYSFNGKHLLLPKGSKVLGQYSQEPNGPRVAVIWDRIVTPSGIDVTMASPGIDNLGGAGHPGYYNAHWGSRISSALLISLLSDAFKYEAAEHGPKASTVGANGTVVQQPFESNTAQTIQNLADQAVRRAANRPATVTINQGTVVTIYVAKDVDFTGVLARN
ncbi:type IV secretion system protein VirB10 [Dyella sp. OK004]|uniref:TrbI/VirB10 family protein n=1 Tax=Dyella sp. OK004 TaxID=1855292 RepID=UPI0008E16121|nr:TrbI/VirB10 family protein [Dyella sp. OK004]SFR90064.1 type IV secretion system protein VirB10 [Dyella sp. OK004]